MTMHAAAAESSILGEQLFSDDEEGESDVLPDMLSQISSKLAETSEIFRDVSNEIKAPDAIGSIKYSFVEEEEEDDVEMAIITKRKKRSRILLDDDEDEQGEEPLLKKQCLNHDDDEIEKPKDQKSDSKVLSDDDDDDDANSVEAKESKRLKRVLVADDESENGMDHRDESNDIETSHKLIEDNDDRVKSNDQKLSRRLDSDEEDDEKENIDVPKRNGDSGDATKNFFSHDPFSRMGSDLFDAEESSEDDEPYNTNFDDDDDEETDLSKIKAKVLKSGKASKGKEKAPKSERKTKKSLKQQEEELISIHSETQRLARESKVTLPYYIPPKRSLEEFLNRPKFLVASRPPRDVEFFNLMKNKDISNINKPPILPPSADLTTLEIKMAQIEEDMSKNLKKAEETIISLQSQKIGDLASNLSASGDGLHLFLEDSQSTLPIVPSGEADPVNPGAIDALAVADAILPNCLGIDPSLSTLQPPLQDSQGISQNPTLLATLAAANPDDLSLTAPLDISMTSSLLAPNLPNPLEVSLGSSVPPTDLTLSTFQNPLDITSTSSLPPLDAQISPGLQNSAYLMPVQDVVLPLSDLQNSLEAVQAPILPTFGKDQLVSEASVAAPNLGSDFIQDLSEEANSAFPNKVVNEPPLIVAENFNLDSNTQLGSLIPEPDPQFAQLKKKVLKSVSNFVPKIEGSPNTTIDLSLNPDRVAEFKERFLKHQLSLKPKTSAPKAVKLQIISKETDEEGNDELKQEELIIQKITGAAPGTKLDVLKEELFKQIMEKKKVERKEKLEMYNMENERVEEEPQEMEELLDVDEDEAEFTDPEELQEDTEEEKDEDLIEDDVEMDDKDAPINAFVDDEAEETDEDFVDDGASLDAESDKDEEPSLSNGKESLSKAASPPKTACKSNLLLIDSSCEDLPGYQISKTKQDLNDSVSSSKTDSPMSVKTLKSPLNSQLYRPSQDKYPLTLSPLVFNYRSSGTSLKNLSSQLDKSLNNNDSFSELANLCSAKFDSPESAFQTAPKVEDILKAAATQESDNEEDLLGLCSAKFTTQNVIHTNKDEEEDSDFEETVLNKKKLKQRRLFQYSDEEDETDKEDEEMKKEEENEEDYDEDEEVVINEEEEIVGRTEGKDFFEKEAELSGSDASSDEMEDEDDAYDEALIDDTEKFSNTLLQKQIEKLHRKQLRDEEEHELRLLKERLIEDSDLYSDGPGRKRQFRWSHLPPGFNDQGPKEDDKSDGEEVIEDESWRIHRYEREKWLRENKNNEEEEEHSPVANSPFFKINHTNKRQIKPGPHVNPNQLDKKPGSFLARGKEFLNRLADKMKTTTDVNNVGGQRATKSFVFRPVSPPKKQPSASRTPNAVRKHLLIKETVEQERKKSKSIFDILENF